MNTFDLLTLHSYGYRDNHCWGVEPESAPCQYLVKNLPVVLKKKTKVKDIFYTDKKRFIKFKVD